ncbi:MAG: IclR family transcriptional regulator [Acidobacteria bacterium]|nr:IclR family transcriptional regulator [Acidobacteriota bacterium]
MTVSATHPPKGPNRSRTLQTLERGLDALGLLSEKDMGATEIANQLGVDRATAHRILRTLVERGYVKKRDFDSTYQANLLRFLEMVEKLTSRGPRNWLTLAESCLEELHASTELSANLCMAGNREMVYMLRIIGSTGLAVNNPPGTKRPLHCTAVGKAYLGALSEPDLRALLATLPMPAMTPHTITSASVLARQIAESRAQGFYVDDGEMNPRIRCVAAPILDGSRRPIAAIGLSGPVEVLSKARVSEIGTMVVGKARQVSFALGYPDRGRSTAG